MSAGRCPGRVIVWLRAAEPGRLAEGKTKAEIMRCLKRYIAREIYHILCPTATSDTTKDLAHVA